MEKLTLLILLTLGMTGCVYDNPYGFPKWRIGDIEFKSDDGEKFSVKMIERDGWHSWVEVPRELYHNIDVGDNLFFMHDEVCITKIDPITKVVTQVKREYEDIRNE